MENSINGKKNIGCRRQKMSIENRAKQFAPFSALRGLPEELTAMEKIVVSKLELSEYMEEELNKILSGLKPGDMATVIYFSNDEYIQATGMIARIDAECRILQVVEKKIDFDNIFSIKTEYH